MKIIIMKSICNLTLLVTVALAVTACSGGSDAPTADALPPRDLSVIPAITITTIEGPFVLAERSVTTDSAVGTTVAAASGTPVAHTPLPAELFGSLALVAQSGGATRLGEIYQFDGSGSKVVKTFTGRPFMRNTSPNEHSFAFNEVDGRFYGFLSNSSLPSENQIVLMRFDPVTDKLELLKTLDTRGAGKTAGPGITVSDLRPNNTIRTPLVSKDGKSLMVMVDGGRAGRGLLLHVVLDQGSANYLKETVVYDFFSRDVEEGLCSGLVGEKTEMVWSRDRTKILLGTQGSRYILNAADPTAVACAPAGSVGGAATYTKNGRIFSLAPSVGNDLSRPWTFTAISQFNPVGKRLGRYLFEDASGTVRWTVEDLQSREAQIFGPPGSNTALYRLAEIDCHRIEGVLPISFSNESLVACSGLDAETSLQISAPKLLSQAASLNLSNASTMSAWIRDEPKGYFGSYFAGLTSSPASGLLFAASTDVDAGICDESPDSDLPCTPSQLLELDPSRLFFRKTLATGSATLGKYFHGNPATGSSASDGVLDRYVVWLASAANEASHVVNKYDRFNGKITSVPIDPDRGAYPYGKLQPLGPDHLIGLISLTSPSYDSGRLGGHRGSRDRAGGGLGVVIYQRSTMEPVRMAEVTDIAYLGAELVLGQGDSAWLTAIAQNSGVSSGDGGYYRQKLLHVDTKTLKATEWVRVLASRLPAENDWKPAIRGDAVYYAAEGDISVGAPIYTVACARISDPKIWIKSLTFGPNSGFRPASEGLPVGGPVFVAAQNAMYMAMAQRADGNPGGSIWTIDRGLGPDDLCRSAPVLTKVVGDLPDVPSTGFLSASDGALYYGTTNGKLMRFNPATGAVTPVANLAAGGTSISSVRGFLTEVTTGSISAVVYDYDAQSKNVARRVSVVTLGGRVTANHDVTRALSASERYPGVSRLQ